MKRTLKEILTASLENVHTLRTHPQFPCISLMSNGVLVADVPNLHKAAAVAINKMLFGDEHTLGRKTGPALFRIPQDRLSTVLTILGWNDSHILEDLARGVEAERGWDTGKRFAATLASGKVGVRLPVAFSDHGCMESRVAMLYGLPAATAMTPETYAPLADALEEENIREVELKAELDRCKAGLDRERAEAAQAASVPEM